MVEHRGPRFRMYMEQTKKALFMRKDEWMKFALQDGTPVEIEIDSTPLHRLATVVDIVGTFAQINEDGSTLITIVRKDTNDAPNFINVDKYEVWHNGPHHAEFQHVVVQASTNDDEALRGFLEDYVMIIPLKKDEDYHLPDIPAIFKAILKDDEDTS
jgi:hypothetical protein